MCDQQSLRPACAYAQSDQSLCLSLEYSMIVKLLTEHHLEFLSLKGGCRGSSESTLVKMSKLLKISCRGSLIVSEYDFEAHLPILSHCVVSAQFASLTVCEEKYKMAEIESDEW